MTQGEGYGREMLSVRVWLGSSLGVKADLRAWGGLERHWRVVDRDLGRDVGSV